MRLTCLIAVLILPGMPVGAFEVWDSLDIDLSPRHPGAEFVYLQDGFNDDMDLVVLEADDEPLGGRIVHIVPNAASRGDADQGQPGLKISEDGKLQVTSADTSGTVNWWQTITVAERDARLIVTGFSWRVMNMQTEHVGDCTWDLLRGDWSVEVRVPGPTDAPTLSGRRTGRTPLKVSYEEWAPSARRFASFCVFDGLEPQ